MILKKSMPFLFIPLFISLVACLGDQNDITNESQVNLLDDFNYTAYWKNNEQVQERCVKSDSLCIEEHWVNIGEPTGLSYLPVEEISSSSKSSSSEAISSPAELSSSSSIEEISSSGVVVQTVATPTFSIEARTYTSTQSVAISTTTAGATIHYTTNGSIPKTSSTVYSGSISVSTSQTLKAIAIKTTWDNSAVASAEYIINLSPGTFTDSRDSKIYKTTTIGTQVWMAENLNYETTSGSYCYDDDSTNCDTYGRLYTWTIAMDGASSTTANPSGIQGVCPTGWHLPSDAEWETLASYIANDAGLTGSSGDEWTEIGQKLKTTTGWMENSGISSDDAYGFSGLPGGRGNSNGGSYNHVGKVGHWWSSTENENGSIFAYYRYLSYYDDYFYRYGYYLKSYAHSVRCIQDNP
jgi:uncharacterized protein (TIGR02145 family)